MEHQKKIIAKKVLRFKKKKKIIITPSQPVHCSRALWRSRGRGFVFHWAAEGENYVSSDPAEGRQCLRDPEKFGSKTFF